MTMKADRKTRENENYETPPAIGIPQAKQGGIKEGDPDQQRPIYGGEAQRTTRNPWEQLPPAKNIR